MQMQTLLALTLGRFALSFIQCAGPSYGQNTYTNVTPNEELATSVRKFTSVLYFQIVKDAAEKECSYYAMK